MSWRITDSDDPDKPPNWEANYAPFSDSITPHEWDFTYEPDTEHNEKMIEARGTEYIGKYVLIGLTHCRHDRGEVRVVKQEQIHDHIVRANCHEGTVVRMDDGSEFKLPPDLTLLEPAARTEYTLTSTGEVVRNPDYITTWRLTQR